MSFTSNLKFNRGSILRRESRGDNLWSISIAFQPFEYKNLQIEPTLGLNDVDLGTNQAGELAGKSFSWDSKYFDSGVDASLYTLEHDYLKYFKVTFGQLNNNSIQADIESTIDFSGFDGSDGEPSMQLNLSVILEIK